MVTFQRVRGQLSSHSNCCRAAWLHAQAQRAATNKNLGGDDLRKIATVIDELELA